jgi:hypothetical protein
MISNKASVTRTAAPTEVDFWAVSPREILWRCTYLDESDYLSHTPFLFWLVRESRPGRIVTLGLETAVAHFALCQAVDKLGLGTLVYGIAPQFSNQTAKDIGGEDAISRDILNHNARNYSDFSRLYCAAPDTAGKAFEEESIDVLLLDVALAPGVFDRIEQTWVDRLSDQGVIILQGTDPAHLPEKAQGGFQTLCKKFHHFHFPHGKGLTVLLKGTQHSPRIMALAAMEESQEARRTHQQVFMRLGMAQLYEHTRQQSIEIKHQTDTEFDRMKNTLSRTETALKVQQDEVNLVVAANDKRSLAMTRIYAQMFDLETETKTLRIERDAAQLAQRTLEDAQEDRESEMAGLKAKMTSVIAEADAARIALRDTEERVAVDMENAEQAYTATLKGSKQTLADRDKLKTQHDNAIAARDNARAERDGLKTEHDKALKARDSARAERDGLKTEHDKALKARDSEIEELRGALVIAEAELVEKQVSYDSLQETARADQTDLLQKTVESKLAKMALDARFRELALITAQTEELQTHLTDVQKQSGDGQARDWKSKQTTWKNDHALLQQELNQTRTVYDKAITDVTERIKVRDIKVREMSAVLHETRQSLKTAKVSITTLVQERDKLKSDIAELHNSSSWRLTEPLRRIRNKIGK